VSEGINYYDIYDKPHPYKGLLIYPVLVKDYCEFSSCIDCLNYNKNETNDIKILQMSYLDYLLFLDTIQPDVQAYIKLFHLLCLVLRFPLDSNEHSIEFRKDTNNNTIFFIVDGVEFLSQDFDEIRKIILLQHCMEYEEWILDEKIKKALAETAEFNKKKSFEFADFEEQTILYHLYTGLDYEKIYDLTIRKFTKGLQILFRKEDYKLLKGAELAGTVTFKEEIKHPFSHIEPRGAFDGLVVKDADKTINTLKESLK